MDRRTVRRLALALAALALALPLAAQAKPRADDRVAATLDKLGLRYKTTASANYSVVYGVGEDRSQAVFIMSATDSYNDIEIREIWSIAGTFPEMPDAETLAGLLLDNAQNKIGNWSLEELEEGWLLFYSIKAPVGQPDESFRMMLEFASDVADEGEELYFGGDEN